MSTSPSKIKEQVYDKEISPLVKQIHKACKTNGINMAMLFQLDSCTDGSSTMASAVYADHTAPVSLLLNGVIDAIKNDRATDTESMGELDMVARGLFAQLLGVECGCPKCTKAREAAAAPEVVAPDAIAPDAGVAAADPEANADKKARKAQKKLLKVERKAYYKALKHANKAVFEKAESVIETFGSVSSIEHATSMKTALQARKDLIAARPAGAKVY